jgi:sulfate adenylyltransferase subunit 2
MRLHDDVLGSLEAEAIQIFREVVAECERPVLLFSAGKDSAVLLHLARKAFFPAMPPFPLLHVDTMWKFREMYAFRDQAAAAAGMTLRVHRNPEAEAESINPFDHGASVHTDIWKTQGLKQALDAGRFDAAFGGARRDEEKSRAKERIVSVRTAAQGWDPKRQRPELWSLYNTRLQDGESVRVFPLSNWIELDIWRYIQRENIALPSLYFAAERPVLERDGALLVLDDDRMPLRPGEAARMRRVRFRTLGCWPLTAAIESDADTLEAIAREISDASLSERQGRAIDHDPSASMERKKREGYF